MPGFANIAVTEILLLVLCNVSPSRAKEYQIRSREDRPLMDEAGKLALKCKLPSPSECPDHSLPGGGECYPSSEVIAWPGKQIRFII